MNDISTNKLGSPSTAAKAGVPFINNGPLISWMYPVFGLQGARITGAANPISTVTLT